MSVIEGRIPPHSLDAEMAVLGAMMLDEGCVHEVVSIVKTNHFYRDTHRYIYEAILSLFEDKEIIDLITLSERLRKRNKLEDIGGTYYLTELNMCSPTTTNVEAHARIVYERYLSREMINVGYDIFQKAYDVSGDGLQIALDTEAKLSKIIQDIPINTIKSTDKYLSEITSNIFENLGKNNYGIKGLTTGLTGIDNYTLGLQGGDFAILAARPSMGKTALALTFCSNNLEDKSILFFSLETSAKKILLRLLSLRTKIPLENIRLNTLTKSKP